MLTRRVLLWGVLLLAGCAPPGSGAPASGTEPGPASTPKTIVVATLAPVKVYGHTEQASGGGAALAPVHSEAVITNDKQGGIEPRLATKFPSLADGSVVIRPDGRMQVTWTLRDNIKWQDGVPFTAEDLAFSLAIQKEIPGGGGLAVPRIESIEATDPHTAVITWQAPFFRHLELSLSELWPYPKHLLADVPREDKEAFMTNPYWTSAYVHLGPFRLADFGLGNTQVFQRFDDYFLGKPKVDSIIIQSIPNANTLFANLLAGAVDIASEESLPTGLAIQLRDNWKESGGGVVLTRIENLRYAMIQLNPDWARTSELARDARARRGLYYGLDRDAIRQFSLPGLPDTEADGFLRKNDPRGPIVGEPLARYRYDPARALQELAEVGWRRGPDGHLLNQTGEPVQFQLRGSSSATEETSLVAQLWRQALGVNVEEEIVPANLTQDREYRAKFPGLEFRSSNGDAVFGLFDSRVRVSAENQYRGSNPMGYNNPAYDRVLDRFFQTLDLDQQAAVIKEMSEVLANDVPIIPLYVRVDLAAVRTGVRALADDYAGTTLTRGMARNAYLWDRD